MWLDWMWRCLNLSFGAGISISVDIPFLWICSKFSNSTAKVICFSQNSTNQFHKSSLTCTVVSFTYQINPIGYIIKKAPCTQIKKKKHLHSLQLPCIFSPPFYVKWSLLSGTFGGFIIFCFGVYSGLSKWRARNPYIGKILNGTDIQVSVWKFPWYKQNLLAWSFMYLVCLSGIKFWPRSQRKNLYCSVYALVTF